MSNATITYGNYTPEVHASAYKRVKALEDELATATGVLRQAENHATANAFGPGQAKSVVTLKGEASAALEVLTITAPTRGRGDERWTYNLTPVVS